MVIKELFPESSVKALDERALSWLPSLDQFELNAVLVSPLIQCLARKFRPLSVRMALGYLR